MAWNTDLEGNALEIAGTNKSPLRVVAGPGTGKTFALMHRIARLLEENVDPSKILLITFTRVAANDLEFELRKLKIPNADLIHKGTLHSICYQILKKSQTLSLTNRIPRFLMDFEVRFLLEDLKIPELGNFNVRKKRLKAFEAAWATEQDQTPGWPLDDRDQLFQSHLLEWLRYHKAMLIGEFVPITLKYLRDNPGCSERSQYLHVLVDEYQDLNKAEQSLIDLLSEKATLTVIGDEDQSIYENFRYAHPEGISDFEKTHLETYNVPLDECRRCPKDVVNLADSLIQNNKRRQGKKLLPKSDNVKGDIFIVQWNDMNEEANGIANFIKKKIETKEFDPGQILILSTRRQFGYRIRDFLHSLKLPAHSFFNEEALKGNPKKVENNQAQEAFTLLTLLVNPDDIVALRCWLGFGNEKLCQPEYAKLLKYCSNHTDSPSIVLDKIISGELQIDGIDKLIKRYELLQTRLSDLKGLMCKNLLDKLFPLDQPWSENIRLLTQSFQDDWPPEILYEKLSINISQPELPTDVEYIRVMSLHKSKGLTADHVFVTGLLEGLLPSQDSNSDATFEGQMRYVEEQRRLFYVAITRPKKTLVLSSVLNLPRSLAYNIGAKVQKGGTKDFALTISSTFLSELGQSSPKPIIGTDWKY